MIINIPRIRTITVYVGISLITKSSSGESFERKSLYPSHIRDRWHSLPMCLNGPSACDFRYLTCNLVDLDANNMIISTDYTSDDVKTDMSDRTAVMTVIRVIYWIHFVQFCYILLLLTTLQFPAWYKEERNQMISRV